MKKLLAIFMLCFAVFAANAQVFLLQESFESDEIPSGWTIIDNDGDGNNWYVLYGQGDDPEGMAHTGIGHITSASWQSSAFTPDNYLITGGIEIPANANQPTLSWWAKGQDPSWAAEHYAVYISTTGQATTNFTTAVYEGEATGEYVQHTVDLSTYAGQTIYVAFRHYNITDMFRLNLDDIEVYTTPTEPTLSVNPTSLDFGTVFVGMTGARTANVTAFSLTGNITISTTAPFAVSLDGETYSTSVSMPAAGGTLYVQYAPTAVGTDNGTVTLTSGDLTATITVTGNGFDCGTVTTFPYTTDFSNEAMNDCWIVENTNGDSYTWEFTPASAYASIRWNSSLAADDWLISPAFTLTGNQYATFDYKTGSSYDEKFEVAIIQGSTRTVIVPEMTVRSSSYLTTDPIDLSAYTGDYRIGIHCTSDADMYRLYVTNFTVANAVPTLTVSEEEIDFGTIIINETADEEVTVSTLLVTEAVTVTTAAPFAVSLDGTTFAATATIPAATTMANTATVYVRFAPTAVEEYTGTVIFTAGEMADTVLVSGNGFECAPVSTFPYETNFTDDDKNLCWTIEDANNDGSTFEFYASYEAAVYAYNSSNNANDWLISPEFVLTGSQYVAFDYYVYSASYPEKFSVHLLQGTDDITLAPTATYTNVDPATMTLDLSQYTGTYQIAIHAESDADEYALFITNFIVDDVANLEASLTVDPTNINFGTLIYAENVSASRTATVSTIVITEAVTATTAAPFSVSLDGITYSDNVTFTPAGLTANTQLYVKYAPTEAGSNTGNVTITDGTHTATIALNGAAIVCDDVATLPFTEDFEGGAFPPTCWALESTNNVTWESKVSENDNSTWAYCNYAETGLQDEKLITKTIDFTTDQSAVTMTFDFIASYYYITSEDPSEQYNLLIYASTDNGATFSTTPVYDMRADQPEFENWTATSASIDLSSLIGQTTVKLMFNYYGTYGAEMWIDNINIAANTVGIEEETAENAVSIYPNPASTMLNVHAENFDNVQIINFLGQVVYSSNVTENDFQINVSNLSNGVYFIRLNGENTVTKKFVKR